MKKKENFIKISIIIPVYNQEKYISDCLNSVINQDIKGVEIIIVNDGSTDNSDFICQEYMSNSTTIKYIRKSNGGLSSARNVGVTEATGEYVFFLDSDDIIETNCLSPLYEFAKAGNYDVVYFDEMIVDNGLRKIQIRKTFSKMSTTIEKEEALLECFEPSHVWARIYKRTLISNMTFKNIWFEDMEWFPRVILQSNKIGYFKLPIYYYRQHNNTITNQKQDSRNLQVLEAWDIIWNMTNYSRTEKKAIERALKFSIFNFMFFRNNFAKEILDFYNKLFSGKKYNDEKEDNVLLFAKNIPIYEQSKFYNEYKITNILERLDILLQSGGILKFDIEDCDYERQNENKNTLYLSENLSVKKIEVVPHCSAIKQWIYFWKQQNLISLKGEKKVILYDKNLILQCMIYNFFVKFE